MDDLTLTEQFIDAMAESPEQAEAVKRTLGLARLAAAAAQAWVPERPPVVVEDSFDEVALAREAVDRYRAWVDSYPDDEPVSLPNRLRALRLAKQSLRRLESGDSPGRP